MTHPDPASWIGRTESCPDVLDIGHIEKIALSLGSPAPTAGAALPALWHWGLFIKAAPYPELGTDGHARRGGFLPPADDRNRMWAGGRVRFIRALLVGRGAHRASTIASVKEKQGRSGKLLFVTVRHEYVQDNELCISEEQDIVYRDPVPPKLAGTEPAGAGQWSETISPDSIMLFRYSAVTFNGHRIHYDEPYATGIEGYPGLVVHGPLIATFMCRAFERAHPDKIPISFSYRGLRPLTAPGPFRVAGALAQEGFARLWAEQDGTLAHQADVGFKI